MMMYHTFTVKQVFSTMEFLGWYTIGDLPNADDVKFHEQVILHAIFFHQCYIYIMSILSMLLQVCADHENSLLIKLNPVARTSQVQLVGTSLFLLLLLCRTTRQFLASSPMSRLLSVTQYTYTYIDTETETEV